eukprot:2494806-Alexandrium_andersonii.AAC.1
MPAYRAGAWPPKQVLHGQLDINISVAAPIRIHPIKSTDELSHTTSKMYFVKVVADIAQVVR